LLAIRHFTSVVAWAAAGVAIDKATAPAAKTICRIFMLCSCCRLAAC
jgi:hypothetical protein